MGSCLDPVFNKQGEKAIFEKWDRIEYRLIINSTEGVTGDFVVCKTSALVF